MTELITDNFNRPDRHLGGSISDEGWIWAKTRPNPDFMEINEQDGVKRVINGSGIGFRIYMADEFLSVDGDPLGVLGNNIGVQVDILDELNSRGFDLPLLMANPYDGSLIWAGFDHVTGVVHITQRVAGVQTQLATDTIVTPSLPYTAVFFLTRPPGLFQTTTATLRVNGVNVLSDVTIDTLSLGEGRQYAGLAFTNTYPNVRYDNFKAGLSWLLDSGVSAPSTQSDYNGPRQRSLNDRTRLDSLLGGRQNTILTSPMGLGDTVPTARVHLLGRC